VISSLIKAGESKCERDKFGRGKPDGEKLTKKALGEAN
jgi:hypothetical protein